MFEFNGTLIVAMISFVVFMFVMNAIFYRPILGIIRKRDDLVNQNYEQAKELADNAQKINAEYQTKLTDAKTENRTNMALEIENAQKKSFDVIQQAKDNAKIQIQNNKDIIEKEKENLYGEVNSELIKDLSSQIVKKVVG
jgi:F-type H+-transporting ATPase subunit b